MADRDRLSRALSEAVSRAVSDALDSALPQTCNRVRVADYSWPYPIPRFSSTGENIMAKNYSSFLMKTGIGHFFT